MSRLLLVLGFLAMVFSKTGFAADCPSSDSVETSGASNGSSCTVEGSASTIQLNFISGFTDTTAISATGGNNGTTVGAQRKLSFIKAAEVIADQVASAVVIEVDAAFAALSCTANQATLGSAGAATNTGYGSPAPDGLRDNTFYPIGLLNAIRGFDVDNATSDITSQFNSNIGNTGCLEGSNGWYYGFDAPPANTIGFVTVLLHEMTHGFGFASLVNKNFGTKASGLDDIYSVSLFDDVTGRSWMDPSQSDADRAASATSGNRLLWNGTNVNDNAIAYTTNGFADKDSSGSFTSGDLIQMYAPNPVEGGSSVSHFDTAVSPNELMEPQYTEGTLSLGLAKFLLQDIGWTIVSSSSVNTAPTITAVDQTTDEDVAITGIDVSGWANDSDGDTLTFSVSSCPTNITCEINSNGSGLSLTPAANYYATTNSVTINVNDGEGGSASDSFNLTVNAVNDAPTWSTIPNQTLTEGNSVSIDLSPYSTDIENDALTYNVSACGAGLSCNLTSGSTLTIEANGNSGNTVAVIVEVADGSGASSSTSFSVTINAAPVINSNPVITAINQSINEDDSLTSVDASAWASDVDGDTLSFSITSCPSNITCNINSNGTNLSLTPVANYFGSNNSVTISVEDGQGGSASDSFNLTVNAINDAPTWSTISDQLLHVGETIDINLTAKSSDIENDALSYSINECGSALSCSINNDILSIIANNTSANVQRVEVSANDGNGAANSTSFNVGIERIPSLMVSGQQLNPNDTGYIGSDEIEIDISHLNSNYYFSISLNGNNLDTILEASASSLQIGVPSSGQFAGTYILSVTDKNSGEEHLFYLVREPSIVLSASSLLSEASEQTLTIIGAAPNTVYSLVSSEQALTFADPEGNNITNVTIQDDSNSHHATSVRLSVGSVLNETAATVQVDTDIEANVTLVPSRRHQIQVQDENTNSIPSASIELNITGLSSFNLAANYESDFNGLITILLPADSTSYAATVLADGYTSDAIFLAPSLLQQTVGLTLAGEVIRVGGKIEATGSLSFADTLPTLTLLLSNGLEIEAPVSQTTTTSASFNYEFNDSIGTISKLRFDHPDAQALTVNYVPNSEYLIFMESQTPLAGAVTVIGSSGGGSLGWILLSLCALLLKPRMYRKR